MFSSGINVARWEIMQDIDRKTPHSFPLTLRPKDLADRLGVSRRYLYLLLKHPDPARRLPTPFKMGRATFWRADDVRGWIDRQSRRTD